MRESTITFQSADGITIQTYLWEPACKPRGVVQVQHGLAEHAGRYRRFATALTGSGYVVYGPDARGSGRTANGHFGDWGPNGWLGWVSDIDRLNQRVHSRYPDLRVGIFGHSLGSFATQQYLLDHSDAVDAVVLSGTTDPGLMVDGLGAGGRTDLSSFNAGFTFRTGYEWLSRDDAEVDAYVADPACGFSSPAFTGVESLRRASDTVEVSHVRPELPVLLVSGTADPLAGGGALIRRVAERYLNAGLTDVDVRLYPHARHELLNETNRKAVTSEILEFFDRTIGQ